MEFSNNLKTDKPYYLPLLIIISIISHFPFVLKGFGELDATRIGVSVIDLIKHGSEGAFINFYFTDVIPLYILYLKTCMNLFNYNYEYLPIIMNYTNAVFGTMTIIPSYILIHRLFKNPSIAFCSVLALIFAPTFYQSTIAGFPHLISFFFLMTSFCFYLYALDLNQKNTIYPRMIIACLFLLAALLFKLDYILGVGAYFGFLYVRKVTDKRIVISTCLIIMVASLCALVFRHMIIGSTGGATSSTTGMSEWINTFLGSSPASLHYLKRQLPPIIYAAGIMTFLLGMIAFIYHLFKKNIDGIAFTLFWTAIPTIAWIIIHGNNARHNMLSILPFLVIIVMVFFEKAPRYISILTVMLILGNYFITAPSSSILRPSGNLFESHALLENRMTELRSKAREIANINEDKVTVLGYFHNPYIVFEIISSAPYYEAVKIGREDYKITTGDKEYMIFYFGKMKREKLEEGIENKLTEYSLDNHVFVSATYDLTFLNKRGIKTRTFSLIKTAL